jgi:general secretion pathway protein D
VKTTSKLFSYSHLDGFFSALLCVLIFASTSSLKSQEVPPPMPTPTPPQEGEIVFDRLEWANYSLDQVLEVYTRLTGRIAIKGESRNLGMGGAARYQLKSSIPLTKEDMLTAIQNILAVNGIAIANQGEKFFTVVMIPPDQNIKGKGLDIEFGSKGLIPSEQMVSRIIQLKFLDPAELKATLMETQIMKQGIGVLKPFPRTNSILIIDTAANIIQMLKIISHLDRPLEATVKTKFYQLKNAKAADVEKQLTALLGDASKQKAPGTVSQPQPQPNPNLPPEEGGMMPVVQMSGGELILNEETLIVGKPKITSDERTNQIILITREANFPFFDQMIERLDATTAAPMVLKTIPLNYAQAGELSDLLREVLGQGASSSSASKQASSTNRRSSSRSSSNNSTTGNNSTFGGGGGRNQNNAALQPPQAGGASRGTAAQGDAPGIFSDDRTNSLIVMGTEEEVKWIQKFVRDVDVLLPQVLLEGIVAEVSLSRTDSFGVNVLFRAAEGQLSHGVSFNNARVPIDATALTLATLPTGLPAGLNYFATLTGTKIDAIVQALTSKDNVKILSQPMIQTSHNKPARIFVGEERPFIKATAAPITGGTDTTLRSEYETKEIGLDLDIVPLINTESGLVTLDIIQKVKNVRGSQVIDGNQIPIVSNREANSWVSVKDGSIVVLGGLISNSDDASRSGIPFLSDIPILGYLFSNTTKTKTRTELLLLLKATVLKTPESASDEQKARREALELFQLRKLNPDIDAIEKPHGLKAGPVPGGVESLGPNFDGMLKIQPAVR